jgi:type VI secretion system protein ImpE
MDPVSLGMAQIYREALHCEALRTKVFEGKVSPLIFGEPAEWMALLVEALKLSANGKLKESQLLRDTAFEAAPATSGRIDDRPFDWIADADSRLGPMLEVILNGRYYWVPFQNIQKIAMEEPADLRDLVWTPALFTWSNGGELAGLIPTRYCGSDASEDSQIVQARKTEWTEVGDGLVVGTGQRVISTDADDFSLMDIRLIELETDAEQSDTPAPAP